MLWREMQRYLVEHTRRTPGVRWMISASWYGVRRSGALDKASPIGKILIF